MHRYVKDDYLVQRQNIAVQTVIVGCIVTIDVLDQ
jgi:hypothetical protein